MPRKKQPPPTPTPAEPDDSLLTKSDVAQILRCSKKQIDRWAKLGIIPGAIHVTPKTPRWRKSDIMNWIRDPNFHRRGKAEPGPPGPPPPDDALYSKHDLAGLLKASNKLIEAWLRRRHIPPPIPDLPERRWRKSQIQAWIADRSQDARPAAERPQLTSP